MRPWPFSTAKDNTNHCAVADRMGIEATALSRLENGKMLNPTLAMLHKWAEALIRKLKMELAAG